MVRGSRRGCLALSGASVGIDDGDDSTFTLDCADNKTYHFQARDQEERDTWIQALLSVVGGQCSSGEASRTHRNTEGSSAEWRDHLDTELQEAEGYHRLLDQQVNTLQQQVTGNSGSGAECQAVLDTSRALVDTIRQCLDMVQEMKSQLRSVDPGVDVSRRHEQQPRAEPTQAQSTEAERPASEPAGKAAAVATSEDGEGEEKEPPQASVKSTDEDTESGSEDDEFFEASEDFHTDMTPPVAGSQANQEDNAQVAGDNSSESMVITNAGAVRLIADPIRTEEQNNLEAGMESNKSIITHLLSQVRIGMDLTKVVLPTFILEKRSMLEMYADFFAHADLYSRIPEYDDARQRFVEVVRWYVSAFHAGRQSSLPKKPYNPILGETFQCMWDVSDTVKSDDVSQSLLDSGPVPWANKNCVTFIAEQVSHHPPVAAFYAEHASKKISANAHIWTKSKFLGLGICAHLVGEGHIINHVHNEEYIVTFPSAYARSILTTPWMEMGGQAVITCPTTGHTAKIDFLCKPFYGGSKHRVQAELLHVSSKKAFMTLEGYWNGVIYSKTPSSPQPEVFVDTKHMPIVRKLVQAIDDQGEFESRRLWRDVTENLTSLNIEQATSAKFKLEERQRREAKERKEQGVEWVHKLFSGSMEKGFYYHQPLGKRMATST